MSYAGDLTPQQAWDLLTSDEGALLVDVRTLGEWQQIGVPDADALGGRAAFVEWLSAAGPNPAFVEQLLGAGVEPGDGRSIVFLCRSGVRSIAAAQAATAAGLGPAYNVLEGFEGGIGPDGQRGHDGWRAAGLPWKSL
ncbi:rhodanese-like domain-containing protein [Cellulomonas composti]|uniref:Rhodanese domain-containing protein n=1 Tax=Cellulomonas composti TaxID=266130 RepID=A0A511JDA0_9CELL|nr:rhodanese-like domain-containing protein [Cellulomonas composti]GEL95954.1 hypothetical protein CCO02nite_26120 [Cellulomonas composti]